MDRTRKVVRDNGLRPSLLLPLQTQRLQHQVTVVASLHAEDSQRQVVYFVQRNQGLTIE